MTEDSPRLRTFPCFSRLTAVLLTQEGLHISWLTLLCQAYNAAVLEQRCIVVHASSISTCWPLIC